MTVTAQLSAQRDELQAEKDALLKESQAKQAQYDGLVGQLQQQVNDGNLKITQYKNMLTVRRDRTRSLLRPRAKPT